MKCMPKILESLIEDISKLPGIGKKTAERLAIHLLDSNNEYLKSFSFNISSEFLRLLKLNKSISRV